MPAVAAADTHTIKLSEGFRCQPQHLYEAFTNAQMMQAYTQSKADCDPKPEGKFSLYDGNIEGTFVSLKPNQQIVWKWRSRDWEPSVYSQVTIDLSAPNNSLCRLDLTQSGIPHADKFGTRGQDLRIAEGWKKMMFIRIQQATGWVKVGLDDE